MLRQVGGVAPQIRVRFGWRWPERRRARTVSRTRRFRLSATRACHGAFSAVGDARSRSDITPAE
jgi:hypothetical protein